MGKEDDFNASIAHVVLCCVAGRGVSAVRSNSFVQPGMHANLFLHGVIGFLHYQSSTFNNDFRPAYNISYKASRYLPLPSLMADLYRGNNTLSMLHLASGVIPFALALSGKDDRELGNLMIAGNIISLCHYSLEHKNDWGWCTAGAAIFAYFLTAQMGPKVMYPLGLALMEYFNTFQHYMATLPGGALRQYTRTAGALNHEELIERIDNLKNYIITEWTQY